MSKYFSFSQSEAKNFLAHSKTIAKIPGLKLIAERKKQPEASSDEHQSNLPNQELLADTEQGKLLIVIPRRVANAAGRNLIRRRLKAIYFENNLFENQKRHALFVYPEAKSFSYDQLKEFLLGALSIKKR